MNAPVDPHTQLPELAPLGGLIGSTRVDGIPTIYAPREGLIAAGIMFRVGRADEPLALSGITHLVEHLALFDHSNGDVHHNGETSDAFTHFYVAGSEQEVVAYLNRVCRSLRDLPLDRLETEKQILRTESGRRTDGAARALRSERFGATGFGIAGMGEVALDAISPTHVAEWTRTHFTRQNSIVWMTTAQPLVGLDLHLPDGSWMPLAPLRDIVENKPAFFGGPEGGVALDAIIPRSTAGSLFATVASKALYRSLRQEGGFSYTATCDYEPVDASHARVVMFADALPHQQSAVVGGLIDVLATLRAGVIEPGDLAHAKMTMRQMIEGPDLGARILPSTAQRLILGARIEHPATNVAEAETATAADIAAVADQVWRDALAQIPEGSLAWAGFTQTPVSSEQVVTGHSHAYIEYPDASVVVGEHGLSFVGPESSSTVFYSECAALLAAPDGLRVFIGPDAFRVVIEPTLIRGITPELLRWLDSRVPPNVVTPLRARNAEEIPQPGPPPAGTGTSKPKKGFGVWAWFALVPAAVLSFILLMSVSGDMRNIGGVDGNGEVVTVSRVVVKWVASTLSTWFAFYLLVGLERRRGWRKARRGV